MPFVPPRGLYVITDSTLIPPDRLTASVSQAIAGGAVMVQYRDKQGPAGKRLREADALAQLCRRHAVPFIVNDDIELARAVDASGVHLGAGDAPVGRARERLGDQAIIGISCYDRLERARAGHRAGADYLAFGRFFPSSTKPEAVVARPDLLTAARREFELPIVAIGGITPENAAGLVAAGAGLLAVIHGVFGQPDIEVSARRYTRLYADEPPSRTGASRSPG